jgi:UDP:flavonoid glycosyltransferase YjiC (YdhE family)
VRITILTFGSRGDVQPYVALGAGLAAAGHRVRIATHAPYRELAADLGLEFQVIDGDPAAILASELGEGWLRAGGNPVAFVRGLLGAIEPFMHSAAAQSWQACRDADVIVVSMLGLYAGRHVAERMAVPLVLAPYLPVTQTGAFPSPIMCAAPGLGPLANRLTYAVSRQLMWLPARPALNRVRRDVFGLPPLSLGGMAAELRAHRWPVLYGYSRHVVPRPPEWRDGVHVTGYWFVDRPAGWRPPPRLTAFLESGPPPVYVGFGSMHVHDPATTAGVVRALALAGRRGLMLTAPGETGELPLPDGVLAIEPCPHDWLLPRVAAAVHHGGAGTTAAGLRAGVPSVVIPFFADQPFWGWRVAALGAGPPPIPRRRLTAERLASAIRTATGDPGIRRRAAELGARIREEDGVARAVEAFERCLR